MNEAEKAFWERLRLVPVKRKSFLGGKSKYRGVSWQKDWRDVLTMPLVRCTETSDTT